MTQPTQGPTEAVAELFGINEGLRDEIGWKYPYTGELCLEKAARFLTALKARGYIVTREYQE